MGFENVIATIEETKSSESLALIEGPGTTESSETER